MRGTSGRPANVRSCWGYNLGQSSGISSSHRRSEIKAVVCAMPEGRISTGDVALWCLAGVMALVLLLLAPQQMTKFSSHAGQPGTGDGVQLNTE